MRYLDDVLLTDVGPELLRLVQAALPHEREVKVELCVPCHLSPTEDMMRAEIVVTAKDYSTESFRKTVKTIPVRFTGLDNLRCHGLTDTVALIKSRVLAEWEAAAAETLRADGPRQRQVG